MAKIQMQTKPKATVENVFYSFIAAAATRGVKEKTLLTYKQHFCSIAKRLDINVDISELTRGQLDEMIFAMRKEGLADTSINSYTRTLKVFLSWCNEEGYTGLNIALYKASESVKETYSDEELRALLKKPSANCSFCEYRNWVIVNFLLNSGCRASTIRNIQIRDVDLTHSQITSRHNKNGKTQMIPLCGMMLSILRDYMTIRNGEQTDFLFCDECGGLLTENALRLAIVRYNKSRGVEKTSIHAFRHTFARKFLVDCGGNAFTLQKILGHSTLAMTKHYCNIFNADITRDFDQYSPLAQLNKNKTRISKR